MTLNQLALICLVVCISPGSARAGEDVDEIRQIDPNGIVHIRCTRGELNIVGWDRSEAQVEGELDDLAQALQFWVEGEKTFIRVQMPASEVNRGDGADLTIRLPVDVRVRVDSVSADVTLEGMLGPLAIRTVNGDVSATGTGKLIHISTTSGDIRIDDGTGQVNVTTTSGDTFIRMAATDVQVDSVSGDIELELEAFDSVKTSTINAELEFEGNLKPYASIDSTSVNGEMDFRLARPVNAVIDVRTGPGGEIDNELSNEKPRELVSTAMVLETTLGDGSGTIRAVTVDGEIQLGAR